MSQKDRMQILTLTLMDSGPLIQKVTSFLGRTVFPVSKILDSSWHHKFPKLSARACKANCNRLRPESHRSIPEFPHSTSIISLFSRDYYLLYKMLKEVGHYNYGITLYSLKEQESARLFALYSVRN